MRKYVSIIILISIISVFAQAKFGMKFRMRTELQNMNSTDADQQIYDRTVDFRFRPSIGYEINKYLCVKSVFEIGDIQYGSAPSADLGTDGINLETKNAYIEVRPTENHLFQFGLIPYKDIHSMIIDTDVAGIIWKGKFNKYSVDLGWFAASDEGEKFIFGGTGDSYSFGSSVFVLDLGYKIDDRMSVGINNVIVTERQEYSADGVVYEGVNQDFVSIYFAPRFVGKFDKFYVEGQFIANNNFYDFDNIAHNPMFSDFEGREKTGLALSIKSSFDMDTKTTFRANLLFRGCYEQWENYEGFYTFHDTGLEILNENRNGIAGVNPMNSFVTSDPEQYQLGIVLPSLFVDWKYNDKVTYTGGIGFVINDQGYGKWFDDYNSDNLNHDMFIAWELDFKAKVVLYDKITFLPFMAMMAPSDNFAYNTVNTGSNFTIPEPGKEPEAANDMQFKIGTTVKYNF